VQPEAITAIDVHVPPPYLAMIDHGVKSGDRASHITSVSYRLALAAYDLPALFDVGHSPPVIPERIQAFMQKVSVKADEALLVYYPKAWPARLTVRTADTTQKRLVLHVPGDPQRPFDEGQVVAKFSRVVGSCDPQRAERLLASGRTVFDGLKAATRLVSEITETIA
jgi:2-methylcitrate dehydratase PrpD